MLSLAGPLGVHRKWRQKLRRPRERVRDDIALAGDVLDVTRVLRYVQQLAALSGRPWIRRPLEGKSKWLVVRIDCEPPSLKHEPEVSDPGEAGPQFPVESGVPLLGSLQLL